MESSLQSTFSPARIWAKAVVRWLLFIVVLLLPAGSLDWPAAWAFFALYLSCTVPMVVWLQRHRPDLLEERLKSPIRADQKGWDKVFVVVTLLVLVGFDVVLGFDAVRYGWARPPLLLQAAAFFVFPPVMYLFYLTMRANAFLSKSVRIQDGHEVVSSGPYRVVRHPMYTGVILFQLALPIALGSLWALLPAMVIAALVVVRTVLEDRTLHEELPGYRDYAATVRHRLVPGLW